ncbi:MAG: redoxin domain-containing protein [Verrucomicrobia bacterium]|nr:redoxin domain-containing protein [Verrucomicrobiota bacterium]
MDARSVLNISVGANVPDFTMDTFEPSSGSFGSFVLAEQKVQGKWTVLVFYPADFTFVCPTELADLAAHQKDIEALGVKIVSVSTDTKFAHLAWRNSEKLLAGVHFTMAADPTGRVGRMFGVYDESSGLTLRGTFLISPAGKLVSAEVNFYNVGRDMGELLRKLKANTYLEKNPAEACPAKWIPGQKTLKPSEKMVGKVFEALNQ